MNYLDDNSKQDIILQSKQSYPKECCGLLVKIIHKIVVVPCNNISETPEKSFIIDNSEIAKYRMDDIVGFYHSHKDSDEFSLADIAFSEKSNKNCMFYCCDKDIFKEYEPKGMEIPYVGRPFFAGYLDCLTLIRDYYRRELNIHLDDKKHPERGNFKSCQREEMWDKYQDWNILENYLLSQNFIKVDKIKKYDIVLMKAPNIKYPIHFAVYLDDNQILHHFSEFSEISTYSNAYKRFTTGIYRHKSLK